MEQQIEKVKAVHSAEIKKEVTGRRLDSRGMQSITCTFEIAKLVGGFIAKT